jgi:hypothetical protein
MLQITIPATELWNEKTNEFVKTKEQILQLEHSLVSLSKWESKWCKPFMSKTEKTSEETIDYIRCMTVTQNVDFDVYNCITNEIINEVSTYIEAPMTATTFSDDNKNVINREIITAEIIYYWMVALTIPFECQKWHLNRLLTLINVCNIKNQPKKKTGKGNIYARNRALNEARKKELNTAG